MIRFREHSDDYSRFLGIIAKTSAAVPPNAAPATSKAEGSDCPPAYASVPAATPIMTDVSTTMLSHIARGPCESRRGPCELELDKDLDPHPDYGNNEQ